MRRLQCACCGESAGRWHQHSNQDTGYSVCVRCVTFKRMRGESEADILSDYGVEGVNWGLSHEIYGRSVRVLAAFGEHEQDRANEWMLAHPTHALLAISGGLALLADENDLGTGCGLRIESGEQRMNAEKVKQAILKALLAAADDRDLDGLAEFGQIATGLTDGSIRIICDSQRFEIRVTRALVREYNDREIMRTPFDRIVAAGEYEVTAEELKELIKDAEWHGDVEQVSAIELPAQTKAMYRRFHAHLLEVQKGHARSEDHA
jgi:hypothetical protein